MNPEYHRLLLLFVDGVGLAPASQANPLATAPMPAVRDLLGGPLTVDSVGAANGALLEALDARLGVAGLPQSATGQTALFSGVNAARKLGRHATGFVGAVLRGILETGNLFSWARRRGLSVVFANAYGPPAPSAARRRRRPDSVTTVSTAAAGLERRSVDDLERGRAVTWDVERDRFSAWTGARVPPVSARTAGEQLAALANTHQVTVFETFLTDLAGHRRGIEPAEALRRVDSLLAGVRAAAAPELTVLLTSDHGNLEESSGRTHTLNPVPLLAFGPRAASFRGLGSILAVTPRILASFAGAPT